MAEEVCSGDAVNRAEVFDLLYALVDKSLVMIETEPDGESRYTMLESLWDYGDEKLKQHGETSQYRSRHLDYFVRFAEEAEKELNGPNQVQALERLSKEHYNLGYALRWSVESPDGIERGLRLAGALTRYWEVRSYLAEGSEQFDTLLARADATVAPAVRAKAERGAGRLAWCQDRDADALRHYREAQRIFTELGMPAEAGFIEAYEGFTERNEGRIEEARAHFERALATGEAQKFDRLIATALSGLGSVAGDHGDFTKARELKERALAMFRSTGDKWIISLVSWSLGKACIAHQDYAAARTLLNESLTLSRELGNKWSVPYTMEAIADICAVEGHAAKAVRLYGAASTQREALALAFSPTEETAYKAGLDRLHSLVSPKAFEAEWIAGRALTIQSAISFALENGTSGPRIPRRRRSE